MCKGATVLPSFWINDFVKEMEREKNKNFVFHIQPSIMWRFKPFMPKEQNGLEGRIIDIGNLKIQVRNAIAEGGFSCVYLARDAIHGPKQYAVKHIICNDVESLELVMKEISVMKSLKGHPNIVRLYAHTIIDMGRTKEALLVMEYCDKSLVNILASRGVGYFEEKQILSIFRDVCNAVFAMHCQSPPIAHRDLKAENILLGSDGLWKLCDFGSTSTNHKCFEKPEEMGIEEDIIRKHTTPAYRAPEMWDLFRRELINEKVDIWALGCLLFCICYLKSAFDGESKLQILNGNYRIPDLPKYDASLVNLIRDMLQSSPNDRPDITQKSLPDRPPEMELDTNISEAAGMQAAKSCAMPCRSPPPPPSAAEPLCNVLQSSFNSKQGSPLGAFWSTKHANDSVFEGKTRSKYDEETTSHSSSRNGRSHFEGLSFSHNTNPPKDDPHSVPKDCHGKSVSRADEGMERPGLPKLESRHTSQNDAFNAFVTEFKTNKFDLGSNKRRSGNDELLEADVEKLKEQLKQANVEKDEITSKCEKLSAICRSQQQEIQELKQALASQTPPNKVASENQTSIGQPSTILTRKKIEGSIWELQQGLFTKGSIPDSKPWQAFTDDPVPQTTPTSNAFLSVTTKNCLQNKKVADANSCDFGTESFTAVPSASSQINISTMNSPQQVGKSKNMGCQSASQPAGWAGF